MSGLDRDTGRLMGADAHLVQSIADILSTPRGTRVMRREYGSDLPALVDSPINGETLVDVYQATAEALDRWEPRFRLRRVETLAAGSGRLSIALFGDVDHGAISLTVEVTA